VVVVVVVVDMNIGDAAYEGRVRCSGAGRVLPRRSA
jgi:hypothetical protein